MGKPVPHILPHPDDVIIDYEKGARFLGPLDEREQKQMEETIQFCDVLFMQDALDQRSSTRRDRTPMQTPGGAKILAMVLQRTIPPRLQLSDNAIIVRQARYLGMPKRRLLKELYAAWKKLGHHMPRGFVFPDRDVVVRTLKFTVDFAAATSSGDIDVEAISHGKFDDNFLDLLEDHGQPIEPFLKSRAQ